MSEIFKAYDIRGRYPAELDERIAYKIGFGLGSFLGRGNIVIGRDIRRMAPSISAAVVEGLKLSGSRVIDIGVCTTPMLYFGVASARAAGGVMVTASHNPPEYIGMKLCRQDAIPIGRGSGLEEVRAAAEGAIVERTGGCVESRAILDDYVAHLRRWIGGGRPIRAAVDFGSGAAGAVFDAVFEGHEFTRLCAEPDPDFKNHEADPLKDENVQDLAAAVRETGSEIGVAFDGDGDRCILLDADGKRVAGDLITILLAREALARRPGAAIVYDLRSSRAVAEEVERAGGRAIRERVGHAFIKHTMRRHEAAVGGELSGHFYFQDHFYADSGLMACARVLSILRSGPATLAERVAPFRRYAATGEINFEVADKEAAMARLAETYRDREQDRLDGITVSAKDWWFNVRPSNTEPRLRLNLEAVTAGERDRIYGELLAILGAPV